MKSISHSKPEEFTGHIKGLDNGEGLSKINLKKRSTRNRVRTPVKSNKRSKRDRTSKTRDNPSYILLVIKLKRIIKKSLIIRDSKL